MRYEPAAALRSWWHGTTLHTHGAGLQGGGIVLTSGAAAAAEQPDGQSGQEVTKRCLMCGDEHTLFYFPVRKSHPDGWVHCFPCQREQRQKVKASSGCVM